VSNIISPSGDIVDSSSQLVYIKELVVADVQTAATNDRAGPTITLASFGNIKRADQFIT